MPLLVVAAVLALGLGFIALMPLSLFLRYRAGKARRQARGWVAALNVLAIGISVMLFLVGAAVTSVWIPDALSYGVRGLAGGLGLGVLGLLLSRWEATPATLHYTPNRWLVLGITLVVSARILYGVWRGLRSWSTAIGDTPWLAALGVAESLAAGGVVLGYYLAYWVGLWWRLKRHERRRLTPMRAL